MRAIRKGVDVTKKNVHNLKTINCQKKALFLCANTTNFAYKVTAICTIFNANNDLIYYLIYFLKSYQYKKQC